MTEQKTDFWLTKGIEFEDAGKFNEAIEFYDNALQINPILVLALINKAKCLIKLRKIDEGIVYTNRALDIEPANSELLNIKGVALCQIGKYVEGSECYNKALDINPNSELVWYNKGIMFLETKRFEEALDSFSKTLTINANNANAWYGKGDVLFEKGQYPQAISCYERAMKINAKDSKPWVWSDRGTELMSLGKYSDALTFLDKASQVDPNDPLVFVSKGIALKNLKRFDEASALYDRALTIDEGFSRAYVAKASLSIEIGDYSKALEESEKGIASDPKYEWAWVSKGYALYLLKNYEESLKTFYKAAELNPNEPFIYEQLIGCCNHLRRYTEAVSIYQANKLNLDEYSPWMLFEIGFSYYQNNLFSEAIKFFSLAFEKENKLGQASNGPLFLVYKGDSFACLGNVHNAHECYCEALTKYYDNGSDIFRKRKMSLAETLIKVKRYPEAIDTLNQALSENSNIIDQHICRALLFCAFSLSGDLKRRSEIFSEFFNSYQKVSERPIVDETKFDFKGLIASIQNEYSSIEDKFLSFSLIYLLQGKVDNSLYPFLKEN